jgi:hypothetical protein
MHKTSSLGDNITHMMQTASQKYIHVSTQLTQTLSHAVEIQERDYDAELSRIQNQLNSLQIMPLQPNKTATNISQNKAIKTKNKKTNTKK